MPSCRIAVRIPHDLRCANRRHGHATYASVLLIVSLLCGNISAQTPVFTPQPVWVFEEEMGSIVLPILIDIDRDGDVDLLRRNWTGTRWVTRLWRNRAPSVDFEETNYPEVDWDFPVVGDVNQDGYADIFFSHNFRSDPADPYSEPVTRGELILNDGGVLGASRQWISRGLEHNIETALVDLDQDGDLDIVGIIRSTTFPNPSYLTYYLNRGPVDLFPTVPDGISELPGSNQPMVVGDLDGDGDPDVIVGNAYDPDTRPTSNCVFFDRGPTAEGGFFSSNPDVVFAATEFPDDMVLGDVDGDGDLDLVLIAANGARLYLNRYDEGGPWSSSVFDETAAWAFSSIPRELTCIALGDVDRDGALDLIVGGRSEASSRLFLNQGAPPWFSTTGMPLLGPGRSTANFLLGDIDGDGRLDILSAIGVGFELYANQSPRLSTAPAQPMYLSMATRSLAAGDVDGDGDVDLVAGNAGQSYLYRLDPGAAEVFPPLGASINRFNADTRAVLLVDLDLDGYPELVFANDHESNTVHRNLAGTFETFPVWVSPDDAVTTSLAAGDLNGDGRPDLLFGNSVGRSRVVLNENGSLADGAHWEGAGVEATAAVALADLDLDGDLDAVFGNVDQVNTIYVNNGSTLADAAAWRSRDKLRTFSIAVGDVDGDGYPDIVCGNDGQPDQLYSNTQGVLTQGLNTVPYWVSAEADSTRSIDLVDVDGDGDLDLVCGVAGRGSTYHLNAGGQLSAEASWRAATAMNTQDIAVADFDADGDVDLVCGNLGQVNTVYAGTGHPLLPWDLTRPTHQRPDNPTVLSGLRVIGEASNRYAVSLTIADAEADPAGLFPRYRYADSPLWHPVEPDTPLEMLTTSPGGETHAFSWDISRLPLDRRDVVLSVVAAPSPQRYSEVRQTDAVEVLLGPLDIHRARLAAPSGLEFSRVTIGDTVLVPFSVGNTGNLDLVVSEIVLPLDDEFAIDEVLPLEVPPASSRDLTLLFAPRSAVPESLTFGLVSNDPIEGHLQIPLRTDVTTLEFETILLIEGSDAPLGDALPLVINPGEFVRIERGAVHFRPAGSADAFAAIELVATADAFTAVIPGQFVTEVGLEFFVEVENSGVFATDPPDTAGGNYMVVAVTSPAAISTLARPNSGSEYLARRAINIDVVVPDGTAASSGRLHYRRGGEESYLSSPLAISPPYLLGTIPDSIAGSRGIEYWVEVQTQTRVLTDPPVAPAQSPHRLQVTVPDLAETATHPGGQYRMISVPLQFKGDFNGTMEALLFDQPEFGSYDPARWRSFRWLPSESRYAELSEEGQGAAFRPAPGQAFWLVCSQDSRITTAPITATSTPTSGPWQLELQPGWNQVGTPFAFAVAWDSVQAAGGEPLAQIVEPPVAWARGTGYQDSVRVLEPWQGYWVKNISDPPRPVMLEIPAREALMTVPAKGNHPDSGWRIAIRASAAGVADGSTRLGCAATATTGWDPLDRSEPPLSPGRGLSVHFPHADWGIRAGRYTADVRDPIAARDQAHGHLWFFDVAKNFRDEGAGNIVTLDFDALETVPADLQLSLLDRELDKTQDLRTSPHYEFHLGARDPVDSAAEARFIILVGDHAYVDGALDNLATPPVRTALHQNYPNPFNPETVIRWDMAQAGRIDLKIYDLTGALVKTVHSGFAEPGGYEFVWRGEDEAGRRVASGVYIYRLVADDMLQTKRMLLLK